MNTTGTNNEKAHLQPEERERILEKLKRTRHAFVDQIEGLSDEQWQQRLSESSWSVVELAEHVALVEKSVLRLIRHMLSQPPNPAWTDETSDREGHLGRVMPNRRIKVDAPERVRPRGGQSPRAVVQDWQTVRQELIDFAGGLEGPVKNLTHPHPFPPLGTLNLPQWIVYAAMHQERHMAQIAEILRHSQGG